MAVLSTPGDLGELEEQARRRLPAGVYDFFAGGAGDELTLAANVGAWDGVRLRPRVLRDVSAVDTATTVLGTAVASPVGVAPTAFHRLAHPEGEAASAAGAARAGALYALSTRTSATPTEVESAAPGAPRWFQAYVLRDRGRTAALVEEAVASGCRAVVLTGDTPLVGRRLRDVRNRFRLPDDLECVSLALGPDDDPAVVDQDASVTFDAVSWLAGISGVPVVVKGVLRADDACRCVDAGAAAVWVSNHGGRQLDGAVATADALPEVAGAVGDRAEVYVDGGIRRGVDVVRALALGARLAFVGRPVLWGLAVDGAAGVEAVLRSLRKEVALAMALCGATSVAEVTSDLVALSR